MNAQERRLARKNKILSNSSKRMDLVNGFISNLKEEEENADSKSIRPVGESTEAPIVPAAARVDPKLRRRQAAERKKAREAKLREATEEEVILPAKEEESPAVVDKKKEIPATFNALRMNTWYKVIHVLLVVLMAVSFSLCNDSNVYQRMDFNRLKQDPVYEQYIQLQNQGVDEQVIRSRMIKDKLIPEVVIANAGETKVEVMENSFWYSVMHPFETAGHNVMNMWKEPPIIVYLLALRVVVFAVFHTLCKDIQFVNKAPFSGMLGMGFNFIVSSGSFGMLPTVITVFMAMMEEMCIFVFTMTLTTLILYHLQ